MTNKELLLQEIESLPDSLLTEALELMQKLKAKKNPNIDGNSTNSTSEASILKHAGKWVGDDFDECLDLVYASRGKAQF